MTKQILLVDDEEFILKSLKSDFEYQGFSVAIAASGEEALSKSKKTHYDLVITDLAMPGIDGLGVLNGIREHSPETAIIILTGYGDMRSAIEALRLGADDYLLKPCDAEELMLRAERCLEKQDAFRKIKLFSYSVSHDLKNPTIALHGLVKLLVKKYQGVLPEKGRKYCEQIMKSADEITALVEQINFFISTSEHKITVENFNPKEIIQLIRAEYTNQLTDRGVKLVEPDLLPEVQADKLSTTRIFRNLIGNALKYGGKELSEIKITHEETDNHHQFSVVNDGIGLEAKDCKKLFGFFERKDMSNNIAGTGLGLAIVRELATLHGGDAWAKSHGERGVSFYFTISKSL